MPSSRRIGALLVACALAAAVAPAAARASTVDYPDFSSVAGLTLGGSAARAGSVLRLTGVDTAAQQLGSAFSTTAFDPARQLHTSFTFLPHGGELQRAHLDFRWERGPASLSVSIGRDAPWDPHFQVYVLLNHASGEQEGFFKGTLLDWDFGQPLELSVDWWPASRTLQVSDAWRVPVVTVALDVAGALGGPARPGFQSLFMAADQDLLAWHADDAANDRSTVALSVTPEPSGTGEPVTLRAIVADADDPAATPTGTVRFYDGAAPLGDPVGLDAHGGATLTQALPAVGAHQLRASYRSSGARFSDGGALAPHQVRADPTATTGSRRSPPSRGWAIRSR